MTYDDAIEWPNGCGFTPCSKEYAEVMDCIDAMSDFGRISMNDMSGEDYQSFNVLLAKRDTLLMSGHVGKSVRY